MNTEILPYLIKKFLCWGIILSLSCAPVLFAKPDEGSGKKKKGHSHKEEVKVKKDKDDHDKIKVRKEDDPWLQVHHITPVEQQVVRDYIIVYQGKEGKVKGLPPGLAKKVARGGELPPGWQKKIARGEVMPFIVYEQSRPLPEVILVKLPKQPPETRLVVLDGKIIRLAESTRTILDVFDLD